MRNITMVNPITVEHTDMRKNHPLLININQSTKNLHHLMIPNLFHITMVTIIVAPLSLLCTMVTRFNQDNMWIIIPLYFHQCQHPSICLLICRLNPHLVNICLLSTCLLTQNQPIITITFNCIYILLPLTLHNYLRK